MTVSLVTEQNGKRHVSTVPLSDDEAAEHIALDAFMHRAAGWRVVFVDPRCFVAVKTRRTWFGVRLVTRIVSTTPYDPAVES